MKLSSFNNQKFEVLNLFKDFLTNNYESINLTLSPNISDIRPFQWHNYHQKNKFKIDVRYTSF